MMDYMYTVWRSQTPTNQSARKHSKLAWWSLQHYSHFSSRLVCNDAESAIEKRVSSWKWGLCWTIGTECRFRVGTNAASLVEGSRF